MMALITVLSLIVAIAAAYVAWWAPARHRTFTKSIEIDPVCGMRVDAGSAAAKVTHAGREYFFCSHRCAEKFLADPGQSSGRAIEAT